MGSNFGIGSQAWTGGAMRFAYSQRCDEQTAKFGPGFVLTDAVNATIRQHQPVY